MSRERCALSRALSSSSSSTSMVQRTQHNQASTVRSQAGALAREELVLHALISPSYNLVSCQQCICSDRPRLITAIFINLFLINLFIGGRAMESNGGGGGNPCPLTASSRSLLARSASSTASGAGAGAFVYDGMRPAPLFSSTNFARSLRRAASFAYSKKQSADGAAVLAVPPRRALSSMENTALPSPRRPSLPEVGAAAAATMAAARGSWEPARRRRSTTGASSPEDTGSRSGSTVLREMMTRKKEESAHRARLLTVRLLQWRFANARMEKAMARATSAAENKLFYTWLRVAELRNIQAAKRIVAQRRRQKLKLARLLRPQLPLLASWEPLSKPHTDAVDDLGRVLSAACTSLPLADGAQGNMETLHKTMFACVGTVNAIEANADMLYATAGVTSSALEELATTIQQELEGLQEAMRLAKIVTSLQVGN
ncbi:hypothetical protein GUJ93_ZPchr0010g8180 [Zizania palustris]|uniref:Uncharacterized protein n=1 Tax=Zizania palustris TaxID=103762 RepID=A0A8J5SZ61_ZIZPA|nr:hypothetical protein GUJ93_ZPchr0010g8180 [Zizania palustris]